MDRLSLESFFPPLIKIINSKSLNTVYRAVSVLFALINFSVFSLGRLIHVACSFCDCDCRIHLMLALTTDNYWYNGMTLRKVGSLLYQASLLGSLVMYVGNISVHSNDAWSKACKKSRAFIDLCYSERNVYFSLLFHTHTWSPLLIRFVLSAGAASQPMELAPCNAKRPVSSNCTTPAGTERTPNANWKTGCNTT